MSISKNSIRKILKENTTLKISPRAVEELRRLLVDLAIDICHTAERFTISSKRKVINETDINIAFYNVIDLKNKELIE